MFAGYFDAATGGTPYYTAECESARPWDKSDPVTLYTQWSAKPYDINYTLGGGVDPGNPTTYNIETDDFELSEPTKTGYTFTGWSGTDLNGESTTKVIIKKGSTGDKTYTAHWAPNTYAVSFDANGGAGGRTENVDAIYDADFTMPEQGDLEREGYKFAGWNTQADGKGTNYTAPEPCKNLTTEAGGSVTLYANWTLVLAYTVPLTVGYSLFIGGSVKSTTAAFESDTVEDLYITTLSVAQGDKASALFPTEEQRNKVAVTLTPQGEDSAVSVPLSGDPVDASVLQQRFVIPKKNSSSQEKVSLLVSFGLSIPEGTTMNDNTGFESFGRLKYVVGPVPPAINSAVGG